MFKYSICNETFQGWEWGATCRQVAECGYRYIEVAPFTLADDIRTLDANARHNLRETAASCGLEVVGLHWLLVSPIGLSITSDDTAIRQSTADYLAALVEFCSDLGGHTMVLGSPAQRRLPAVDSCGDKTPTNVATDRLVSVLSPALKRCSEVGVTICLEPLPTPEADFVLTLEEAAEIVKRMDHPFLKTMLDVKSASSELLSIPELIRRYHPLIKHVHVNDANRRGPGFGETDFVPILHALSEVGYDGPISIEVFDYTPDPITIAQRSLNYLQQCESRLGLDRDNNMSIDNLDSIKVVDNGDSTISVFQDNALITRYNFGSNYARPFFFPVKAPGGQCVTRSYPMETVAGESADHPHHRSLWIAHGDVNGVDNWSEEARHGFTRHQSIDSIDTGADLPGFSTTSLWCDVNYEPLLTQYLEIVFRRCDEAEYMMDFDIKLEANIRSEDLVFGDTKEGGILSVRVASALDASRGGLISNVYGGKQEIECWGKHSHWCSYSGEIDHQPCGIAVFDHPDSFRSPTTWHVRDYGLMTANPFGYSAFTNGRLDGSYTLMAGDSIAFKYRVITHNDREFNAKCSARYRDFAFPPRVRF